MYKLKATLIALFLIQGSASTQELGELFFQNSDWPSADELTPKRDGYTVNKKGNSILYAMDRRNLVTKEEFADCSFKMEFHLHSYSGVYFLSRYEIQLARREKSKTLTSRSSGALFSQKAPDVDAIGNTTDWQTLEVEFRAPRFAADGRKTANAMFTKVILNGKLIHENIYAVKPTSRAPLLNEVSKAPLQIEGGIGSMAIRKIEIKSIDLSHIKTAVLSNEESTPYDKYGHKKVNLVAEGKKAFENKGCIECHSTEANSAIVKTGPSLFELLKPGNTVKVLDKAEDHLLEIPADEDYVRKSIRKPHAQLALNKNDQNRPYLPIMVPYTVELLSDFDIESIIAYIKTLNDNKGKTVQWASKPRSIYNIANDNGAVIVSDRARIQRVDIGEKHSARAFHVGLPGNINYSFDQRIMAVVDIWNGPFLRVGNELDGRGGMASEKGYAAKTWKNASPYFQPLYSDGSKVDFDFREPTVVTEEKGRAFTADKSDFVKKVNSVQAKLVGLKTPKDKVPSFIYKVEKNLIEMRFVPSVKNELKATFKMDLKTAQTFLFPVENSKSIKASAGVINGNKWTLPAGIYAEVTFSAERQDKFIKVYTAGEKELPLPQSSLQKVVWHKLDPAFKPRLALPKGYELHSADLPKDDLGRSIKIFEPLGIDFLNKNTAFISTRTAGIWKIKNNQWHQFAEGTYESLGIIAESENSVVIGEKTGLMRLVDNDSDNWADYRENLSDHFRSTGNYHEYLHGPVKYGDSLLYNLNLSHRLPGNYKANGKFMGTPGGLRGWLCEVKENGEFSTFASGFRSPAGLGISPTGEITYTENQGEYVGTSKLYIVKKGGFYGNPTGLIDIPGMNKNSPEIQWDAVKNKRELPLALFPHGKTMNAPGNPEWDTSEGKFGPYAGKMLVGDQTQSRIYVIDRQQIGDIEQSALIPFAEGLSSGVMRLKFNPADNSLWIGQTGRGWRARGGAQSALQKLTWNGITPNVIKSVKATSKGFDITFTQSQAEDFGSISLNSWYYTDSAGYGSRENGKRDEVLTTAWSSDRKRCSLIVNNFKVDNKEGTTNTSRVYHINLMKTKFAPGKAFLAQAFYTLHKIPK
jgi:hypothetical protein